jgi:ABC-type transport system involved in cytochrome c biogenesis ATPase subunit
MPGPWAFLSGWWLVDNGDNVPALEFAGLVKRFGDNVAVDHVDLTVPAGSFFGLVGPNGAGKTTSLSMAVGLLRPDGGTVRIFGRDVWADPVAAKALIGVLPDGMALPDRLSGREVLLYLGLLRGMPRQVVAERADELLRVLELDGAGDTAVVDYSTGMRKKITLAAPRPRACSRPTWPWSPCPSSPSRRPPPCSPPGPPLTMWPCAGWRSPSAWPGAGTCAGVRSGWRSSGWRAGARRSSPGPAPR